LEPFNGLRKLIMVKDFGLEPPRKCWKGSWNGVPFWNLPSPSLSGIMVPYKAANLGKFTKECLEN